MKTTFQDELQKRQQQGKRKLQIQPANSAAANHTLHQMKQAKFQESLDLHQKSQATSSSKKQKQPEKQYRVIMHRDAVQMVNKSKNNNDTQNLQNRGGSTASDAASYTSNFLLGVIVNSEGQQSSRRFSNHKSLSSHRGVMQKDPVAFQKQNNNGSNHGGRGLMMVQSKSHEDNNTINEQAFNMLPLSLSPYRNDLKITEKQRSSSQKRKGQTGSQIVVLPSSLSQQSSRNQTVSSVGAINQKKKNALEALALQQRTTKTSNLQDTQNNAAANSQLGSAYNDTFMPRKLQAMFPLKTTPSSKDNSRLQNNRSTIKQSNSEATLKSFGMNNSKNGKNVRGRNSAEQTIVSDKNSSIKEKQASNFAKSNLNFIQVMKDYNLPDLNSRNGDSKQQSTSCQQNAGLVMKDDYCIDTGGELLNSSSLQMLQRINNLPSASVSPNLPAISLEKDFSSAENTLHSKAASNKGGKGQWQAIPLKQTDGLSQTPDLTPSNNKRGMIGLMGSERVSPDNVGQMMQNQLILGDQPGGSKVTTPFDNFIKSNQIPSISPRHPANNFEAQHKSKNNIQDLQQQQPHLQTIESYTNSVATNYNNKSGSYNIKQKANNKESSLYQYPSTFSRNHQPASLTAVASNNDQAQMMMSSIEKQEQQVNRFHSKVRAMSKPVSKKQHIIRSSTTTSLTSVTVKATQQQSSQHHQSSLNQLPLHNNPASSSQQKFKVKRRHDEKLKNFKLRLVNEERQRVQQKELNDENFVSKDLSESHRGGAGGVQQSRSQLTRLVLTKAANPQQQEMEFQQSLQDMQSNKSKHTRDFQKYIQSLQRNNAPNNILDSEDDFIIAAKDSKFITIEQFATPSLQLLNDRKVIVSYEPINIDRGCHSSLENHQHAFERRQMTGEESEMRKSLENQATSLGNLNKVHPSNSNNNVFAFGQRDDSPLRTLFGAGRSKDFKVMHKISANLDQLDNMKNVTPTSIEQIKKLIDLNAGGQSKIKVQDRTQDMIVTRQQKESVLHTRRTSNWQKLIKKIDKKANRVTGHVSPLPDGSNHSLEALQTQEKMFKQMQDRRTLQQSSTVQNFRPTMMLKQRMVNNVPTRVVNGGIQVGYGSVKTSIAHSREQSPRQIDLQSRQIIGQSQSSMSIKEKKGSQKLLPMINLPQKIGRQTESHSHVHSPARPSQYYPMALFQQDKTRNKSSDKSENPLKHYNSSDSKDEMMLVHNDLDDDDQQDEPLSRNHNKVTRHWKQVPIKEQSIACLSRASSLSGFGTIIKDNNNNNSQVGQLRGSKRRLSLYKVQSSLDPSQKLYHQAAAAPQHSHSTVNHFTSEIPDSKNDQSFIKQIASNAASVCHTNTDIIINTKLAKSPSQHEISQSGNGTGKLSRNTVFIRTSVTNKDDVKLVPIEVLNTVEQENTEEVIIQQDNQEVKSGGKSSPVHSGQDTDADLGNKMTGRNPLNELKAFVSLDLAAPEKSQFNRDDVKLCGALKITTKKKAGVISPKRKIITQQSSNSQTPQRKRIVQNDQVPFALLNNKGGTNGNNSNNQTPTKISQKKKPGQKAKNQVFQSVESPQNLKKNGQRYTKEVASPNFGGKIQNSKSPTNKRKIRQSKLKNNVFSGWSTDRNSMKTESAIELFENSVVVKNMQLANQVTKRSDSDIMIVQENYVSPNSNSQNQLYKTAMKLQNNVAQQQQLQMQIRDDGDFQENKNKSTTSFCGSKIRNPDQKLQAVEAAQISKVTITRRSFEALNTSKQLQQISSKRNNQPSKKASFNKKNTHTSQKNLQDEKDQKPMAIHERLNLIASVCTLSYPSSKTRQNNQLVGRSSAKNVVNTERMNQNTASVKSNNLDSMVVIQKEEFDYGNINKNDGEQPSKIETLFSSKAETKSIMLQSQTLNLSPTLKSPKQATTLQNVIVGEKSADTSSQQPPHQRHRSVVYLKPKNQNQSATLNSSDQDEINQTGENLEYFSMAMGGACDMVNQKRHSNQVTRNSHNPVYQSQTDQNPQNAYANNEKQHFMHQASIAATQNSVKNAPNDDYKDDRKLDGISSGVSQNDGEEHLVTEKSFDQGPSAAIVMQHKNMFGIYSLNH